MEQAAQAFTLSLAWEGGARLAQVMTRTTGDLVCELGKGSLIGREAMRPGVHRVVNPK